MILEITRDECLQIHEDQWTMDEVVESFGGHRYYLEVIRHNDDFYTVCLIDYKDCGWSNLSDMRQREYDQYRKDHPELHHYYKIDGDDHVKAYIDSYNAMCLKEILG